jgi:hypothetical protein
MKTFVAVIGGEAIMAFRAEDEEEAYAKVQDENEGICLGLNGGTGVLRADGRPLWDGEAPIAVRPASDAEHEVWRRTSKSLHDDGDDYADDDEIAAYLVPLRSSDEDDDDA